jgi:ubiquinone/menaquinone biosynthesis C-methylase UbiE
MPEQFGFTKKLMHVASELSPVDKGLQGRAHWFIDTTEIEKHLKKNGQYLDIGTGKGHITQRVLEDMEKEGKPLKGYYGIDVADKPLKKVQKRELKRQKQTAAVSSEKNPLGFAWATAEDLPFADKSLDGVSYVFSIHHMDKGRIDKAIEEAKRVIKEDGNIFIAEDLVDTEEQKQITEAIDRKLNWEDREVEHNYKSDWEWEQYFADMGLEIVERKFFDSSSKKGSVRHGFYVLKLKRAEK